MVFTRWLGLSVRCYGVASEGKLSPSLSSPSLPSSDQTDSNFGATSIDAFIRDELSKGRYDPAISKVCFEMLLELFGRTLKLDLGEHDGKKIEIEDVC